MKMRGLVICACLVVLAMLFPCSQTCGQWIQLGLDNANVGDLIVVDDVIYAATYFPGGVFRSTDRGHTWMKTGADAVQASVTAMVAAKEMLLVCTQGDGVFRSSDAGKTWEQANNGLPVPTGRYGNYVGVMAFDGSRLFAGTNLGLSYYSDDLGDSWQASRTPPRYSMMTVVTDSSDVYFGATDGIYVSRNGGLDFQHVPKSPVNARVILPVDGYLYAGGGLGNRPERGLFRGVRGSSDWQLINNDLPSNSGMTLVAEVGHAIVAGMYSYGQGASLFLRSFDMGESWTDISRGLSPGARVRSLVLWDGKLYIGTVSDGVWSTDISTVTSTRSSSSAMDAPYALSNFPNPFSAVTTISFDLNKGMPARLEIVNSLGQVVATLLDAPTEAGTHEMTFRAGNSPPGVYFLRLTTDEKIVMKKILLME